VPTRRITRVVARAGEEEAEDAPPSTPRVAGVNLTPEELLADDSSDGGGVLSEEALAQRRKQEEIDRLRNAERFMNVSSGRGLCTGCGYTYDPAQGDPEYPVSRGTRFGDLPDDWNCPICGLPRDKFQEESTEIAGFAENQGYGLGGNTLTGEQKSLLIFGSLLAFVFVFLSGYLLD